MFIQRHWFWKTSCKNMEIVFYPSLISSDFRGSSTGMPHTSSWDRYRGRDFNDRPVQHHPWRPSKIWSPMYVRNWVRKLRWISLKIWNISNARCWRWRKQWKKDGEWEGKRLSTSDSLGLYTSSYKFMFSMKLRETHPVCQKQMGTFSII